MIVDGVSEIAESKTPRIGLLGGTFDPVHNGHIQMCKIAIEEFDLDQVWLLISGDPPHKGESVSKASDRYEMAMIACKDEDKISPSRYEIDRPGITYTIDTLIGLRTELPTSVDLFYIVGMDTLYQVKTWKDYEDVLRLTCFICLQREGYSEVESWAYFITLSNSERSRIAVADQMPENISSTEIRYRVAQGLNIDELVASGVRDYIYEKKLYLNASYSFDQASEKLKASLSEERYRHSVGVVETAVALAKKYGEDEQKAKWAALLHDCAKEESFRTLEELGVDYGLEYDEAFELAPALIHSKLGAAIAEKVYNILDKDVLKAIKFHTTGRNDMSKLEKIIFLADFIEPNRDFKGLDIIRKKAEESLDEAVLMTLDIYIENIIQKGGHIDFSSISARNQLWKQLKNPTIESDDEVIF